MWGAVGLLALGALAVVLGSLVTHRLGWLRSRPLVATYGTAWRRMAGQPRRIATVLSVTSSNGCSWA